MENNKSKSGYKLFAVITIITLVAGLGAYFSNYKDNTCECQKHKTEEILVDKTAQENLTKEAVLISVYDKENKLEQKLRCLEVGEDDRIHWIASKKMELEFIRLDETEQNKKTYYCVDSKDFNKSIVITGNTDSHSEKQSSVEELEDPTKESSRQLKEGLSQEVLPQKDEASSTKDLIQETPRSDKLSPDNAQEAEGK